MLHVPKHGSSKLFTDKGQYHLDIYCIVSHYHFVVVSIATIDQTKHILAGLTLSTIWSVQFGWTPREFAAPNVRKKPAILVEERIKHWQFPHLVWWFSQLKPVRAQISQPRLIHFDTLRIGTKTVEDLYVSTHSQVCIPSIPGRWNPQEWFKQLGDSDRFPQRFVRDIGHASTK